MVGVNIFVLIGLLTLLLNQN